MNKLKTNIKMINLFFYPNLASETLLGILKEKLNTYNDVSEIKDIEKNNIQIK